MTGDLTHDFGILDVIDTADDLPGTTMTMMGAHPPLLPFP